MTEKQEPANFSHIFNSVHRSIIKGINDCATAISTPEGATAFFHDQNGIPAQSYLKQLVEVGYSTTVISALERVPVFQGETFYTKNSAEILSSVVGKMNREDQVKAFCSSTAMLAHRLVFYGLRYDETMEKMREFNSDERARVFSSDNGLWPLAYYSSRAGARELMDMVQASTPEQKASIIAAPHVAQMFVDKSDNYAREIMDTILSLPVPLQKTVAANPRVAYALSMPGDMTREVNAWQAWITKEPTVKTGGPKP